LLFATLATLIFVPIMFRLLRKARPEPAVPQFPGEVHAAH
jgi:hypothetical protein